MTCLLHRLRKKRQLAQQKVVGDAGVAEPVGLTGPAMLHEPFEGVSTILKSAGCCTASQPNGGMYVMAPPVHERLVDAYAWTCALHVAPRKLPHEH
jgi:hypothetical protein